MSTVYPPDVDVHRAAFISADGVYRYTLIREWGEGKLVQFVMLNPSTADGERDDPTIRRCVGFARSMGFDGICVVNLYAYRATRPRDLWAAREHYDITGGQPNNDLLAEVGRRARAGWPLIAAWGAHAERKRVDRVLQLRGWDQLQSLGTTKAGAPRHPLYVRGDTVPAAWPTGDSR